MADLRACGGLMRRLSACSTLRPCRIAWCVCVCEREVVGEEGERESKGERERERGRVK